jgi:hypothetical protein
LREALEHALGLKFEGEKGEHFFRSTLIQTLFYGIFSAWVLWARKRKPATAESAQEKTLKYALHESAATYHTESKHFDWHTAVWHLRVPMIRALFEQVANPARLGPHQHGRYAALKRSETGSAHGNFSRTCASEH